jgi:hypothetical protein
VHFKRKFVTFVLILVYLNYCRHEKEHLKTLKIFSIRMIVKRGLEVWDLVILAGALTILIWAFLKAAGILHSPTWVEMLPYFGASASIIGGAYKLGKITRGIEHTEEKVSQILSLENRFNKVENEHHLAMCGKLSVKH